MINLLNSFNSFINSHSNDFLIEDLWHNFIPLTLQIELENIKNPFFILKTFKSYKNSFSPSNYESEINYCDKNIDWNDCINKFSNVNTQNVPKWSCVNNSLDTFIRTCASFSNVTDFIDSKSLYDNTSLFSHSMSEKKSYEVRKMSCLIQAICKTHCIDTVIDIGSGKGYLGSDLSMIKGLNVIELDSRQSNSLSAEKRRRKFKQQIPSMKRKNNVVDNIVEGSYCSIVRLITSTDTISTILQEEGIKKRKNILAGLHCCGGLSSTIIRNFVTSTESSALAIVGCCYHFMVEEKVKNFDEDNFDYYDFPMSASMKRSGLILGRNARSLANQNVTRLLETEGLCISMFHRILLQKLLKDQVGYVSDNWNVGNISKKMTDPNNFVEYVQRACVKLGLNSIYENMTHEDIQTYERDNDQLRHRFSCFFYLKCCLSSVIENVITWDRLAYLRECGIENAQVLELFDEMKSPRRFAIVAFK